MVTSRRISPLSTSKAEHVRFASLRVQLAAKTEFVPLDVPWETDAEGGQALAEFAGRAC